MPFFSRSSGKGGSGSSRHARPSGTGGSTSNTQSPGSSKASPLKAFSIESLYARSGTAPEGASRSAVQWQAVNASSVSKTDKERGRLSTAGGGNILSDLNASLLQQQHATGIGLPAGYATGQQETNSRQRLQQAYGIYKRSPSLRSSSSGGSGSAAAGQKSMVGEGAVGFGSGISSRPNTGSAADVSSSEGEEDTDTDFALSSSSQGSKPAAGAIGGAMMGVSNEIQLMTLDDDSDKDSDGSGDEEDEERMDRALGIIRDDGSMGSSLSLSPDPAEKAKAAYHRARDSSRAYHGAEANGTPTGTSAHSGGQGRIAMQSPGFSPRPPSATASPSMTKLRRVPSANRQKQEEVYNSGSSQRRIGSAMPRTEAVEYIQQQRQHLSRGDSRGKSDANSAPAQRAVRSAGRPYAHARQGTSASTSALPSRPSEVLHQGTTPDEGGAHPWSWIREFTRPPSRQLPPERALYLESGTAASDMLNSPGKLGKSLGGGNTAVSTSSGSMDVNMALSPSLGDSESNDHTSDLASYSSADQQGVFTAGQGEAVGVIPNSVVLPSRAAVGGNSLSGRNVSSATVRSTEWRQGPPSPRRKRRPASAAEVAATKSRDKLSGKRPPSRQLPPPQALHLDLPPSAEGGKMKGSFSTAAPEVYTKMAEDLPPSSRPRSARNRSNTSLGHASPSWTAVFEPPTGQGAPPMEPLAPQASTASAQMVASTGEGTGHKWASESSMASVAPNKDLQRPAAPSSRARPRSGKVIYKAPEISSDEEDDEAVDISEQTTLSRSKQHDTDLGKDLGGGPEQANGGPTLSAWGFQNSHADANQGLSPSVSLINSSEKHMSRAASASPALRASASQHPSGHSQQHQQPPQTAAPENFITQMYSRQSRRAQSTRASGSNSGLGSTVPLARDFDFSSIGGDPNAGDTDSSLSSDDI